MENIFLGVQKCSTDGKCTFISISDAFLAFTGYTREEIRNRFHSSFCEMVMPEDASIIQQTLATRTKPAFSYNYRVVAKNGRKVWLHKQCSRVKEGDADFYYCELFNASAYYDLDGYYKNILSHLPNSVIITDTDMKITVINTAMAEESGLSVEEYLGKSCSIFNMPLCGTEDCCIKRYLRVDTAAVQQRPDGGAYRVSFSNLYDNEGNLKGYISVSTDISQLVQKQRKLTISEERYRIALTQTQNAVWEYDIENRTVYQPDSQRETILSEYLLKSVISNMPDSMIESGMIHPDSVDEIKRMYDAIHRGKKTCAYTVRVYNKNHELRWLKMNCSTVFDDHGKPIRAIGITRDVTAEKEMEQKLAIEMQYRDSLVSDVMCAYEVNLTQDEVINLSSDWAVMLGLPDNVTYTKLVDTVKEKAVSAAHWDTLDGTMGRFSLLDAFYSGKREVSCEYRRRSSNGQTHWVNNTAYMIQASGDNDSFAFIYLKDIDEQKKRENDLKEKAERDALTGLFNRNTVSLLIGRRLNGKGTMFMMDIDNFKHINDTYGHLYGDAVLSEFANKLSAIFSGKSVLGRLDGDGFVALVSNPPDRVSVLGLARQICKNMHTEYATDGYRCIISCSIGIAFAPEDGDSFDTLYEKADIALYHAKSLGKNRYSVYNKDMAGIEAVASGRIINREVWDKGIVMQTVMDHLDSLAYVVNPATYEIIFHNQKTRELFPNIGVGLLCYECMRGNTSPCDDCPMQALPNAPAIELHAPGTGRWLCASAAWIDWPAGERYCIINSKDITRYKDGEPL